MQQKPCSCIPGCSGKARASVVVDCFGGYAFNLDVIFLAWAVLFAFALNMPVEAPFGTVFCHRHRDRVRCLQQQLLSSLGEVCRFQFLGECRFVFETRIDVLIGDIVIVLLFCCSWQTSKTFGAAKGRTGTPKCGKLSILCMIRNEESDASFLYERLYLLG